MATRGQLQRVLLITAMLPLAGMAVAKVQKRATFVQQVLQADPKLSWATPAEIPFGTALDGHQLNATAKTPGTFAYYPQSGNILPPGVNVLTTSFSPNDPGYKTATTSVSLTVTPAGNSTFYFSFPGSQTTLYLNIVKLNQPRIIPLLVAPVGEFHQPVKFSCGKLPPGVQCEITPDTVRPIASPTPVNLKITLVSTGGPPDSDAVKSRHANLGALWPFPLALIGLAWVARGRRGRVWLVIVAAALAGPLLSAIAGCGSTELDLIQPDLTITASSLLQTKELKVHILTTTR